MQLSPAANVVTDAMQGKPEAIEALLVHYSPSVTRFAREFCATPEDVEDAVQETLWIASRSIGKLRVAKAFVSWLFTIVRHQCYRLLRLARFSSEERASHDEPTQESAESLVALRHDLARALATLPEHSRQILILRDIEGLPAKEVANQLNMSTMAVKSRLHRARALLRLELQSWKTSDE